MFHDAIEGKSLFFKMLSASGKLSLMGGRAFTSERFLYIGPGGRSAAFSSVFPSAGGVGGLPPLADSGMPWLHRKKRKKEIESAAIRLPKLQRRFGIIAADIDVS